jgi:hypothetical protein
MATTESSKERKDKFAFVCASALDSVLEDPVPNSQERKSWLETLDAPAADDLLTTLRKIFTATYRDDIVR